jgi:lytic murein transglycosylase
MLLWPALAASKGPPADSAFSRCLVALRASPGARRIDEATWTRHVSGLTADSGVLASLDAQPEFTLAVWDYFAVMVDDERVRDGQRLSGEHRELLGRISARYGVPAELLLAIWGIESNFGAGRGGLPVIRSLATLSCHGRRQAYFRRELMAALRIAQRGDIAADRFRGSWAGAFGHTQFMPGTFEWLAVDHDGDGRRDVMDNVGDALASTAHFLQRAGKWKAGQGWGFEVRVPREFVVARAGRRVKLPVSAWAARGVRRADGSPLVNGTLPRTAVASVLVPAGVDGPAFLVLANFHAVFRYNAAERYALAILHLADRIGGKGPLVRSWPTDDGGLSRAERRELQGLLGARGHAVGDPTPVLTPRIIAAVRLEQERLGHHVTGRPGQRLLSALRPR